MLENSAVGAVVKDKDGTPILFRISDRDLVSEVILDHTDDDDGFHVKVF